MKPCRRRILRWICVGIVLASCAGQAPDFGDQGEFASQQPGSRYALPPGPAPIPADASQGVPLLLEYIDVIRHWPENAQQREYQRLERVIANGSSAEEQLRLALVLMLPDTQFQDDARAWDLIEEYFRNNGSKGYQAFTNFLLTLLKERERASRANQRLEQALADEQEKRGRLEKRAARLRAMEHKLADEQRKRETLQKQLEALKAIEKKINDREKLKGLQLGEDAK